VQVVVKNPNALDSVISDPPLEDELKGVHVLILLRDYLPLFDERVGALPTRPPRAGPQPEPHALTAVRQGKPQGAMWVYRDITQQRVMQKVPDAFSGCRS
jgi:hypothetical protein